MKNIIKLFCVISFFVSSIVYADIKFWTTEVQPARMAKQEEMAKAFEAKTGIKVEVIPVEEKDLGTEIRSPITFSLLKGGVSSGIKFTGIPGGHEFNSFILATLQLGGSDLKLDSGIKSLINDIEDKLRFEIFISLDCHICPDVVQALNKFAILNENIACEMIDGGLFPDEVEEKNIQGVPNYLSHFITFILVQAVCVRKCNWPLLTLTSVHLLLSFFLSFSLHALLFI